MYTYICIFLFLFFFFLLLLQKEYVYYHNHTILMYSFKNLNNICNFTGFLQTVDAKFVNQPERDDKSFGDIELNWTIQGNTNLLKQFNIVWYSMDDRIIQTKYIGPEQRRCTIPVTRVK